MFTQTIIRWNEHCLTFAFKPWTVKMSNKTVSVSVTWDKSDFTTHFHKLFLIWSRNTFMTQVKQWWCKSTLWFEFSSEQTVLTKHFPVFILFSPASPHWIELQFLLSWQIGLSSTFMVLWCSSYFSQQRELQFHLLCPLLGCIEDLKLMITGFRDRGILINSSGFRVVNLFCSNEMLLIDRRWLKAPCAICEMLLLSKCKAFRFFRRINASFSMLKIMFQDKNSSVILVKR